MTAQPIDGFGTKIRRLFTRESDLEAAPVEAVIARTFDRHTERRRRLFDEIGDFLIGNDLDLTPLNFGLAYDFITSADPAIERKVRNAIRENGRVSNAVAEAIISDARKDEITPESLAAMVDSVESNLTQLSEIVDKSSESTRDYGSKLTEHAAHLSGKDPANAIAKLVALTRDMVERTREVESQMRASQKNTELLKRNLETARKAADQDHLTGLPNRRSFEATLKEEVAAAVAGKEALTVAFCDIDHFKWINDTHGHDTGDRVLKFVADLLKKISNERCHVARHGGEEFVMVFRGKSIDETQLIVDQAREDLAGRNLYNRTNGEKIDEVTFSAGVADVFAYDDEREALKAADKALYLAKEHGRNRVYIAAGSKIT